MMFAISTYMYLAVVSLLAVIRAGPVDSTSPSANNARNALPPYGNPSGYRHVGYFVNW